MAEASIHDRDFLGYQGHPPDVLWPGRAQLALSLVVNVEEGAEAFDRSRGRGERVRLRGDRAGRGRARPLHGEPLRIRDPRRVATDP